MLFTVFQYLPIFEEQVPGHKAELVKKVKESDDSDADDSGDADDSDDSPVKTELINTLLDYYTFYHIAQDKFYIKVQLYNSLVATITTPPPKA